MSFSLSISHNKKGDSGKSHFLGHLCDALSEFPVKIVNPDQKSDIHLSVISGIKKGCKNVVRIDGVYYDQERLKKNNSIRSTIKEADAVIFQSEWSRTLATHILSISPKKSTVINNGVDMNLVRNSQPIEKPDWDFIFAVSAHWRVNKRFEAILNAFRNLCSKYPKIGMFVLGEIQVDKNERIKTFGRVDLKTVFSVLRSSNALVHICHLDACPNSVVEALCCGVPVVCNNIGGTPEIVKSDGEIVNIDKEYDFKPIRSMNEVGSSSVDIDKLSEGMEKMLNWKNQVIRPDLDIKNIAKQYYEYLKSVLEGK